MEELFEYYRASADMCLQNFPVDVKILIEINESKKFADEDSNLKVNSMEKHQIVTNHMLSLLIVSLTMEWCWFFCVHRLLNLSDIFNSLYLIDPLVLLSVFFVRSIVVCSAM